MFFLLINHTRYLSCISGLSHATTVIIRREENRIRVICHTGREKRAVEEEQEQRGRWKNTFVP